MHKKNECVFAKNMVLKDKFLTTNFEQEELEDESILPEEDEPIVPEEEGEEEIEDLGEDY